jgi:YhcH/YjgK/YiaL family protein
LISAKSEKFNTGRMELGNGVYASCQEERTTSADKKQYEAHKKFIDIHYILGGDEIILTRPKSILSNESLYDSDTDIVFFNDNTSGLPLLMTADYFAILFPHEAHKPLIKYRQSFVKKIVVKVPYGENFLSLRC